MPYGAPGVSLDEYPEQSYYPSAKLRLIVRLEEYKSSKLAGKAPKVPTKSVDGVNAKRDELSVVEGTDPVTGAKVLTVGDPKEAKTSGKPGADPTNDTFSIDVIPRKASWKQNGLRTADTLSVTLKWTDLPIDPRVIRAAAVEFYLGTVDPSEYAQGIRGETRGGTVKKEPLNLVPDTYLDDSGQQRTNLRFQGWVDTCDMEIADGEPTLQLECRDNTQLLIDQQASTKQSVGMKKPLDRAIAEYISIFPQMNGLSVVYKPAGAEVPTLDSILANTSARPDLGPPVSKGGGAGGGEGTSVWDYLTDVVRSTGHIMRVEGTQLIIQRLKTLYDRRASSREDDPYQPRNLPSGEYPVRAFIYGKNVMSLKVRRQFNRQKVSGIEVRSYHPKRKNMLVARFPKDGSKIPTIAGPGEKVDKKWTVVAVKAGITDQKVLDEIAEGYFNEVGRHEIQITIKTKNLSSFGGGNADPDLLDAKAGDTFQLLMDRSRTFSTVTEVEADMTSQALAQKRLEALGFPSEFAAAYGKAYTDAGFQKEFRFKEIGCDWDSGEGVSFEVIGINFIEVRVDAPGPTDDPTAAK